MKEEVKIKILFITNTPVPYGMAVTNRLMSLAKGITANNHEARIIIYIKGIFKIMYKLVVSYYLVFGLP